MHCLLCSYFTPAAENHITFSIFDFDAKPRSCRTILQPRAPTRFGAGVLAYQVSASLALSSLTKRRFQGIVPEFRLSDRILPFPSWPVRYDDLTVMIWEIAPADYGSLGCIIRK